MGKTTKKAFKSWISHLNYALSTLENCNTFDDWLEYLFQEENNKKLNVFENISGEILRQYHLQDIHPSKMAVQLFMYEALKTGPLEEFEDRIKTQLKKSKLDGLSVIIFPLHSLGIAGEGIKNIFSNSTELEMGNTILFSQTNNYTKTKDNIKRTCQEIWPNKEIDWGLLDHFERSRGLNWLKRNPIMFLFFNFSQIEKYENLQIIIERISLATIRIYAAWAITPLAKHSSPSTRMVNNFETLDIHHFLTITNGKKRQAVNCIPFFEKQFSVFEDTNMNIDITIFKKNSRGWQTKVLPSIDMVFQEHIKYKLSNNLNSKVYERLWTALDYFRKSIKSYNSSEQVLLLQTAFEILFLDTRSMKKKTQIIERSWLLSRGKHQNKKSVLKKELETLIDARNNFVHAGITVTKNQLNLRYLYRFFCQCILYYTNCIPHSQELLQDNLTLYYRGLKAAKKL